MFLPPQGLADEQVNELKRITNLPIRLPLSADELEAFRVAHTKVDAYAAGFRWNPDQAEAIMCWIEHEGLFGPMPVGIGKTLTLQYIADLAFRDGHQRICLLLPKPLISQFVKHDVAFAQANVPFNLPIHVFDGMDPARRSLLCTSTRRGLFLLPYSLLGARESRTILDELKPTVILADESYHLRNYKQSTAAKRLGRYLSAHPEVRFVAVSGSITDKSPLDYAHLLRWSLHKKSPLPVPSDMLREWAQVVGSGGIVPMDGGSSIQGLIRWAREWFPGEDFAHSVAGFRKAYRLRLVTCPGVVAPDSNSVTTSLCYSNVEVPDPVMKGEEWDKLCSLIDDIDGSARGLKDAPKPWVTPSGDEIAHAIHTFKWLYEFSAGFYNDLYWPSVQQLAARRRCSEDKAAQDLQAGLDFHDAKQTYHKLLRGFLKEHPHAKGSIGPIDSPFLVAAEMAKTGAKHVPYLLHESWAEMKAKEVPHMAERWGNPVRVCSYKVDHAVRWAQEIEEGGIIWYWNVAVGDWILERLQEAGVPCQLVGAGQGDLVRDPSSVNKFNVCSLRAHYKGWNLQHHGHMFYVQWPRSAIYAEQSVGRIHRQGQLRDELVIHTCNTLQFDHEVWSACLVDACYQHQSGGGKQKLIYGSFDPAPKFIPPDVLAERGLLEKATMQGLDRNALSMLQQKFSR